jgi:hypothetical protein
MNIGVRPGGTGEMTASRTATAAPIAPRRIPAAATGQRDSRQDAGAPTALPPGMATGAAKEE